MGCGKVDDLPLDISSFPDMEAALDGHPWVK
jgi:hypothetical protein